MAKEPASARRSNARFDDDPNDSFDVPAAVLCAFCGQADCQGCCAVDDQESGVVAIVPWERPGAGTWSRMWSTASASTLGAETFFAALPDGELNPAVRFAVLAELLAVASMITLLVPLAAIALPGLTLELVSNPGMRMAALRWISLGVPLLAAWMVVAHATHGAALDVGARRHGGRPQRRRALRFGLYACGWDLMTGPLGALMTLLSPGGRRAVGDLLSAATTAPRRSSMALLRGVYALGDEDARRANRTGIAAAALLSLLSGTAVVVAIILGVAW
jgi:hypothetical protein